MAQLFLVAWIFWLALFFNNGLNICHSYGHNWCVEIELLRYDKGHESHNFSRTPRNHRSAGEANARGVIQYRNHLVLNVDIIRTNGCLFDGFDSALLHKWFHRNSLDD